MSPITETLRALWCLCFLMAAFFNIFFPCSYRFGLQLFLMYLWINNFTLNTQMCHDICVSKPINPSVLSVIFLVFPPGSFSSPLLSLFLSPQVSFFLFIVFVVYTMLPFSMRDAIIASILTSASHTLVLSVWLSLTVDQMTPMVWQVKC